MRMEVSAMFGDIFSDWKIFLIVLILSENGHSALLRQQLYQKKSQGDWGNLVTALFFGRQGLFAVAEIIFE